MKIQAMRNKNERIGTTCTYIFVFNFGILLKSATKSHTALGSWLGMNSSYVLSCFPLFSVRKMRTTHPKIRGNLRRIRNPTMV